MYKTCDNSLLNLLIDNFKENKNIKRPTRHVSMDGNGIYLKLDNGPFSFCN